MVFKGGLIGYGYWGPVLLRNFTSNSNVKIKTICDRNSSKLKSALTISPTSQICHSDEDIFSDPDIDFVIIATQGGTHYDLVKKGLLSGKHIFVEKPFVLNIEQANDLVVINEKCNQLIMVDHTFLFAPEYQVLKKIIRDEILGKLFHFYSIRADFGKFQNDVNIVGHLMYHDAYILLDLFDGEKPLRIKASGTAHIIHPLQDTALVSIVYPSGLSADIINNMLFPIKERKIVLAGEKAILMWDDMGLDGEKLRLYNKTALNVNTGGKIKYSSDDSFKSFKVSKKQALENQVEYFVACLKEGNKPQNNEVAALRVMQLLESINNAMHV